MTQLPVEVRRMKRVLMCAMWMGLPAFAMGCGSDLGPCDEPAAQELVYSASGLVATKGQALVHDSCGNGAFCHSSAASGSARYGVPDGMNFDMLPSPTGWPQLIDHRDKAWSLVESGDMPPGKAGETVLGDGDWVFDAERNAQSTKLPPLSTNEGKSAFRNWLACGAPLVSQSKVPQWALPASDATQARDFNAIYKTILAPSCAIAGCHNESASGKLSMLDACSAYDALRTAGTCGESRVRPGDVNSLLLDKLQASMPRCGGRMPPTGPLAAADIDAVRAWIMAGAAAPTCN
jgi:hypothetical protein